MMNGMEKIKNKKLRRDVWLEGKNNSHIVAPLPFPPLLRGGRGGIYDFQAP
jgi:hypothetical protein